MDKSHIIREIQRAAQANGGAAPGWRRFEKVSGIGHYDWFGRYWTKWSDAVREAGLEPNRMAEAFDDDFLLEKLAMLTRRLGHVPTQGDLMLAARREPGFPNKNVFDRLGRKVHRASCVLAFCNARPGFEDVAAFWKPLLSAKDGPSEEAADQTLPPFGYVYLLKHGARREYKIGRTNNPLRREGEIGIQLPEKLQPIHYIKTDDPAGVECYWHTRFACKRKEGEWFALSAQDVQAFKRWKRIY